MLSSVEVDLNDYECLVGSLSVYELSHLDDLIPEHDADWENSMDVNDMIALFGNEINILEEAGIDTLGDPDLYIREDAYHSALYKLGLSV